MLSTFFSRFFWAFEYIYNWLSFLHANEVSKVKPNPVHCGEISKLGEGAFHIELILCQFSRDQNISWFKSSIRRKWKVEAAQPAVLTIRPQHIQGERRIRR